MCRVCGCAGAEHEHKHGHGHGHDHVHDHHGHGHGHTHPRAHDRTKPRSVALETDLLAHNDRLAGELRVRFARDRIFACNLIGAPGAGKTALLEHTIRALGDLPISVIEGDQATAHDAERIAATGCRVAQVNTGPGCHLDARMIERELAELRPPPGSLLFVENVGNLVCPALFDLGERAKIVVMSVTEGDDKPLKYPHVVRASAAMIVSKLDLAPHVDADPARYVANARKVNARIEAFPLAAARGDGMTAWLDWLRTEVARAATGARA
jgi:hydrogenase nickel incorporation protein HypB